MVTGTETARDVSAEIAYLTRALKAPTLRESAGRLAERARSESWTHEEYLTACLQREVAASDAHGQERLPSSLDPCPFNDRLNRSHLVLPLCVGRLSRPRWLYLARAKHGLSARLALFSRQRIAASACFATLSAPNKTALSPDDGPNAEC